MTYSHVQSELASVLQSILDDVHPLPNDVQDYVNSQGPRLQSENDRIDYTYLKNLDFTNPIQRFTREITELTFCKLFLVVNQPLLKLPHKKGEISKDLKDRLFVTAIGVCETSHYLENEYRELQWDWVLHNSIQWYAIAIICALRHTFTERFRRLLSSKNLVFKMTMFQYIGKEWHHDFLEPRVHYVPVTLGIKELPEILRFLAEAPEGQAIAKGIAEAGSNWV
ncbi:MAG: hypothetical protein Q9161_008648 [Pseudevernia consocians]